MCSSDDECEDGVKCCYDICNSQDGQKYCQLSKGPGHWHGGPNGKGPRGGPRGAPRGGPRGAPRGAPRGGPRGGPRDGEGSGGPERRGGRGPPPG